MANCSPIPIGTDVNASLMESLVDDAEYVSVDSDFSSVAQSDIVKGLG